MKTRMIDTHNHRPDYPYELDEREEREERDDEDESDSLPDLSSASFAFSSKNFSASFWDIFFSFLPYFFACFRSFGFFDSFIR